ncbi:MAG: 4,5-DOPA dioxygenase extradiol, partial [Gammaproteobacteria bacterium]
NLAQYDWGNPARPAWDWAARFEARARASIAAGDHAPLIDYLKLGEDALLSIPTPEHYLPLLYVLGACQPVDLATFPVEGVDGGGISMLAVRAG